MKTTRYSDYSQTVQKYMGAVEDFLKLKYGQVFKEWGAGLVALADNLENFNRCKAAIAEQGVMITAKNGYPVKHPLLSVQRDLQASMTKLLAEFGLTPRALSKLNLTNDEDDDLKELLGD